MGQSPFWKAVTSSLFPAQTAFENDKSTDKALNAQNAALDKAQSSQDANLEYIKQQNEGLANIGDQYLQMLRQGIESGAFQGNDSLFNAYQQYVLPEYEAGGKFETAPRDSIVTPEMYQYNQQRQQAPTATQYQGDERRPGQLLSYQPVMDKGAQQYNPGQDVQWSQQRPNAPQNQQFSFNQQAPQDMQWNQQRQQVQPFDQQQYAPMEYQTPSTEPWTNTTFNGQKYNTDYQQYQGQQAPQRRTVNDQFQTQNYQQQGSRPDIYRASNAPDAQYFDPTKEQYKSSEFKLENDPVYQRRLELSGRAIEDSAARNGMQLSGANLKALQQNAQDIAAEEGDAAYQRWYQQDQTGYNRFQDRQNSIQNAMQFKSADEYQRYLDNAGIRKDEQGQLIQQWEADRRFGADQNKEAFLREQASKQFGRDLNNDEFSQWLQTDGQKYAQFADQRDWSTSQSNMNADRDWQQYTYEKGFGRDVYTDDRNNMQQQVRDQYSVNNTNRIDSRNFAYGVNQDQQNRNDTNYQNDFANQLAMTQNRQQNYQQNYQNAYNANQDYQNRGVDIYGQQSQNYQNDFGNSLALAEFNQDKNLNAYNVNNANRIDTRNYNADQNAQQYQSNVGIWDRTNQNFESDRTFGAGQNQQNFANQFELWNAGNANFNLDRQFGADQQQQSFGNQFDVWNANNANRTADNSLNFNAWNQQNQNNIDLYKYGTGMGYQQSVDQYGRLNDAYTRQIANKQNQYTTIGDVIGLGMQGRQNVSTAMGNYADNSSDLAIQGGNAYAAAAADKNSRNTVLGRLGF